VADPAQQQNDPDMHTGLAGRRIALEILRATLDRNQPLDEAVGHAFAARPAPERERAFARALATTALRRLGGLNWAIDRFVTRPLPRSAMVTRHLLRLGLAQILFMEVADHGAVDTAVQLAGSARTRQDRLLKGLVNGVLRRGVRERETLLAELETRPQHYLPGWLASRWSNNYGAEQRAEMIRAGLVEPPLDLTPRDPETAPALAEKLGAKMLPTGSLRLRRAGAPERLDGFAEGAFWVQDAAAALPARLLACAEGPVADLCAAPGGKTLQLAAQRRGPVTALDRSAERCTRIKENLARTGLQAEIVTADMHDWKPVGQFPRILLDAPCTATGTLRRHPDIAWTKTEADLASLAELQARLLERAVRLLAPGGVLVYCVCSLEPEEGPLRIIALLGRHPGLERLPVRADEIGGLNEAITPDGDLRTLPSLRAEHGGMDGFYAARLTKR